MHPTLYDSGEIVTELGPWCGENLWFELTLNTSTEVFTVSGSSQQYCP